MSDAPWFALALVRSLAVGAFSDITQIGMPQGQIFVFDKAFNKQVVASPWSLFKSTK